jgi:hypothetical protein
MDPFKYDFNTIRDKIKYYKSHEKIDFLCDFCNNVFQRTKKGVYDSLNHNKKFIVCSKNCQNKMMSQIKGIPLICLCKQCNISFLKKQSQIKKTKNNFCSRSCAGKYNSEHKTVGNRRSKIEFYIETQLCNKYNFEILFNNKEIINAELDIYIPSLKLAFELNGIFHYEPIYGCDKLKKIQTNDNRKFQACLEKNIELCILDISRMKNFKKERANEYILIINKIIDDKIKK